MKIIRKTDDYKSQKPLVLSIGTFDGVHLGHQKIIERLKKVAWKEGFEVALFSFVKSPKFHFNKEKNIQILSTLAEKIRLLEKQEIEKLFLIEFDEEMKNREAKDFLQKILLEKLNVKHLIVGHDHVFGKNKSGNFNLLKTLSNKLNFEVEEILPLSWGNTIVSSSQIKEALSLGQIKKANQMLGYNYTLEGKVIEGDKLGRTLGFPTANLEYDQQKQLPKDGSYIVRIILDGLEYKGMLNVGFRPTVEGKKKQMEVYILDFDEEIYGKMLCVEFVSFLREEKKFGAIEDLKNQLAKDKKKVAEYFSNK